MAAVTVTEAKVRRAMPSAAGEVIMDFVAGEAIDAGEAVYGVASTGKVKLADANAGSGEEQFLGIALASVSSGQVVPVMIRGLLEGLTLAGDYFAYLYLSDTAGGIDTEASGGGTSVTVGRILPVPIGNTSGTYKKLLYVLGELETVWS